MESKIEQIPGVWFPQIYAQTKKFPYLSKVSVLSDLTVSEFSQLYAKCSVPFILREECLAVSPEEASELFVGELGSQVVNVRFGDMSEPGTYQPPAPKNAPRPIHERTFPLGQWRGNCLYR